MILDKIENDKLYAGLNARIAKAFAWLRKADLVQMPAGKYEIDSDDVFAMVQEYNTKDIGECKLEGHRKFIDIQYVADGVERMGVTTLTDQIPVSVKEENDCAFYESDINLVKVEAGMFAIFFPDDLHMPGIKWDQASKVKKVVVKVRV